MKFVCWLCLAFDMHVVPDIRGIGVLVFKFHGIFIMKKILGVMILFGMLVGTSSAMATAITFDVADGVAENAGDLISSVTVSNLQNCGTAYLSASLVGDLDSQVFTLDHFESKTINFFDLDVTGWGGGTADIDATLAFDSPEFQAEGAGVSQFGIFYELEGYSLTWDKTTMPDSFIFAGDLITVAFNDISDLSLCGGLASITATITNTGAAPVPEPATVMLFGTGIAGLVGVSRRRRGL